jgi:hypothetical protein
MDVKESWVSLTGGLGNQLFQFAAANWIESERIRLLSRFGMPRITDGIPDLLYYKMPPKVTYEMDSSEPIFYRKVVGYILRSGIFPRRYEKFKVVRNIMNLSGRILISVRLRKWITFCIGQDVGFSIIIPKSKRVMLIGYFQTYKFMDAPNVKRAMFELELKVKPPILLEHEILALEEFPLVVHVRLGDYRLEDNFGILSENYYKNIDELWSSGKHRKIWLFSDEPDAAISCIPKKLQSKIRIIRDENETPATTLELMRLGAGYVIANSSLSWWGAMLCRNENPVIIAPNPWFRSMPEPKELIPENWSRRDGF